MARKLPTKLVRTMRALDSHVGTTGGALRGAARVSLPGGWLDRRRVQWDLHLKALEQMGAENRHVARVTWRLAFPQRRAPAAAGHVLSSTKLRFTGTEKRADGRGARGRRKLKLKMRRGSRRLPIWRKLLIKMGAENSGSGNIKPFWFAEKKDASRRAAHHHSRPHRKPALFLVAGAIHGRQASKLTGCAPEHLTSVIAKLHEAGVENS